MHEGERWEGGEEDWDKGGSNLGRYYLPSPCREKHRDFDFLSSLEVVIVDQMDVFLMQNWSHLTVSEGWG